MAAAISFHKLALGPIINGLKNAHAFITKSVAHLQAQNDDPNDYLTARLAPDMYDLTLQIQRFTDRVTDIPSRVNPDNAVFAFSNEEKTFAELLDRINRTIGFLENVDEKSFEGREGVETTLKVANGTIHIKFSALEYVTTYAQPNFWFHVVTAYDILRMKGVPLNKFDYLNGTGNIKVERVENPE